MRSSAMYQPLFSVRQHHSALVHDFELPLHTVPSNDVIPAAPLIHTTSSDTGTSGRQYTRHPRLFDTTYARVLTTWRTHRSGTSACRPKNVLCSSSPTLIRTPHSMLDRCTGKGVIPGVLQNYHAGGDLPLHPETHIQAGAFPGV